MTARYPKLPRSFYDRPTLQVARDLVGKCLILKIGRSRKLARIVEVEAYIGQDDPACHAARGKTRRNAVMFGPPGFSYVYLIYGMYHCLNFVSEPPERAAAVLIRAAEPLQGFDRLIGEMKRPDGNRLMDGPGKMCRAFGINREHNGVDLTGSELYVEDRGLNPKRIGVSQRIGIRVGRELPWRFFDADSRAVSKGKSGVAPIRRSK